MSSPPSSSHTHTRTQSRSLREKRAGVPLLLSSFPVPPSHIPASFPLSPLSASSSSCYFTPLTTPLSANTNIPASASTSSTAALLHAALTAQNPPPCAPPVLPLPPVPGPSPLSDQETVLFLSAARARRVSKLSSASSRRSSLASSIHSASTPGLSPSASVTPAETRSLRSYSSNGSLKIPAPRYGGQEKSVGAEERICEEETEELTRVELDDIPSSHAHDRQSDEEENSLELSSPPLLRRLRHSVHDSISEIDMRDLPPLQEDVDIIERVRVPAVEGLPHRRSLGRALGFSATHERSSSQDSSVIWPPPTSRFSLTQLGFSPTHERGSSQGSSVIWPPTSRPLVQRIDTDKALPPLPPPSPSRSPSSSPSPTPAPAPAPEMRAESPDIKTILASTPRPRRKSSGSYISTRSLERTRSRAGVSAPALRRHMSEGVPGSRGRRTWGEDMTRRGSERGRRSRMPAMPPLPLPRGMSEFGMLDGEKGGGEGSGSEEEGRASGSDTDSSIDIHTPLPNLMLRDGLLSPNSKLLPHASPVGQVGAGERPGSHLSVASSVGSIMTKSGLYKDGRDTVQRRRRHRDGKLLRGGIGLTTGLGWSDSEDEGAPSPLTHQISAGLLRSSPSSLRSSQSHPSSRVTSSASLDTLEDDWHHVESARLSFPLDSPSEQRSARMLASSLNSMPSLGKMGAALRSPLKYVNEREEVGAQASSSSSVSAIPTTAARHTLPKARVGKEPASEVDETSDFGPAMRSRVASGGASSVHGSLRTPFTPSVKPLQVPRPLKLPQDQSRVRRPQDGTGPIRSVLSTGSVGSSSISNSTSSSGIVRPAERTRMQSLPQYSSSRHGHVPVRPSAITDPVVHTAPPTTSRFGATASAVSSPAQRPQPRIGTGMTYRTSGSSGLRPTMMRMPSSTRLAAAAASHNADVGVAF
ncbi:uncharacterized protein LAESUDRAFT_401492 [Laetiporus sulphureus 93-53]|uniref:Uncharacterized protein n=1 Tax=Laetiporus sulphureus 93-53 TaxID=1314785 RepID=A0A165CBQ9_9APHY|nr:uncharacterized protein LAESUDRAFT_401492 [Laetiporus sulphureus 93-53]KZT02522.1 hypothetical protein LAESUDRAFT_401492 [Laetiporus sulphureus 93-53]